MDSTGMNWTQRSGPDQAEIMEEFEDQETLTKQKVLVKLALGGEKDFNKAVDEDYKQMLADLESCRMPESQLEQMCRPRGSDPDIDFENLEFNFGPEPGVAPEMNPPQAVRVPPTGDAQVSNKSTTEADVSPQAAKPHPAGDGGKIDKDKAIRMMTKGLRSVSSELKAEGAANSFLADLVDRKQGLIDLHAWIYNAKTPDRMRQLARSLIGAQITENLIAGQAITRKLMDRVDNDDEFERLLKLKHKNDTRMLAAVDTLVRTGTLPGVGNPTVQVNLANVINGDKQEIRGGLSKKNEGEVVNVHNDLLQEQG